jgi:hypothetical protein
MLIDQRVRSPLRCCRSTILNQIATLLVILSNAWTCLTSGLPFPTPHCRKVVRLLFPIDWPEPFGSRE